MWWVCTRGASMPLALRWAGYMGYGMRVRWAVDRQAVTCGVVGCVGGKTRENGGKLPVCLAWCGRGVGLTPVGLVADPACVCSRGARPWERALGVGGAWARLWVMVCVRGRGVICHIPQAHSPLPILLGGVGFSFFRPWPFFFWMAGRFLFCLFWENRRWSPVQAAFRGMAGRQQGAPTLPLPGHVHAAGVGGGASAGHHLLAAHGRLCRGGWVKRGG